jgi:hypothetical protein
MSSFELTFRHLKCNELLKFELLTKNSWWIHMQQVCNLRIIAYDSAYCRFIRWISYGMQNGLFIKFIRKLTIKYCGRTGLLTGFSFLKLRGRSYEALSWVHLIIYLSFNLIFHSISNVQKNRNLNSFPNKILLFWDSNFPLDFFHLKKYFKK